MKVKTISSLEKIFPDREPMETENENVIFGNEKFNFQLAIYNESMEVSKCNKIKISGELAKYIAVRTVELVPAAYCPAETDDYYISSKPGLYPDLLKPIGKLGITISAKQWKSVWITVYTPDKLEPGDYTIFFEIINENGIKTAEISYRLQVDSLLLPKADLRVTNWMHYDCICEKHGVEPFGDEFYSIFEEYLKAYIESGNNMLLIPLFTPPLDTAIGEERKTTQLITVYKENSGYYFSFARLKKFIKFVLDRGVEYLEFSHLFTQWGGEYCPKVMAIVNGKEEKIFGWDNRSDCEEYKAFLDCFLPEFSKMIYQENLTDKCYIHLTDEPKRNNLKNYIVYREMVKKHLPNFPIMDALSDYDFYEKGLVDIAVVSTPNYTKFYDNGAKHLFAYYCCWPSNGYYSNRFLNMPLQRERIIGFQLYKNGAEGFLHWGFNFYNTAFSLETVNPYGDTTAGGFFPAGDSFIVYPSENKVMMTIRAEVMNEAMQDYRLCKLAETYIGETEVQKILSNFGISGFNEYPRNIQKHIKIRQELMKSITLRSLGR